MGSSSPRSQASARTARTTCGETPSAAAARLAPTPQAVSSTICSRRRTIRARCAPVHPLNAGESAGAVSAWISPTSPVNSICSTGRGSTAEKMSAKRAQRRAPRGPIACVDPRRRGSGRADRVGPSAAWMLTHDGAIHPRPDGGRTHGRRCGGGDGGAHSSIPLGDHDAAAKNRFTADAGTRILRALIRTTGQSRPGTIKEKSVRLHTPRRSHTSAGVRCCSTTAATGRLIVTPPCWF